MAETTTGETHRRSLKRFIGPLAILLAASAGTAGFWWSGAACSTPDSPTNQPLGVRSRGDCTELCPELADAADERGAETCAACAAQTAELPAATYTARRSDLPPGMEPGAPGVGTISGLHGSQNPSSPSGNLTR
jgi:hypothetical protein